MIESFRNIFAIPDLRKRLAFTFALLAVYRLGCYVPTPGIDPQALIELMDSLKGTVLVLLAGTIPILSFVAERSATRRTRAGERV